MTIAICTQQTFDDMPYMKAELLHQIQCTLGEGPVYDSERSELLWVDIDEHCIHFLKDKDGSVETKVFEEMIGFCVPGQGDRYVIGLESGFYLWDRKMHTISLIDDPEAGKKKNRINDGKVDPFGNIWGGTMNHHDESERAGNLYRIRQGQGAEKMLTGIYVSNGLAWNEDLERMYYIDSGKRAIEVYHYNKDTDVLSPPLETLPIDHELGFPDGMTIDKDGMLWVAHWDGYAIGRYHPVTGQLITKIEIPAPRVTSCTFGGQDHSTLFVTTARKGLSPELLKAYPLSGSVFKIHTNSSGLPCCKFK